MKLFALVVTYNRKDSLRLCLKRLLNQTSGPDHILVIDNHSTDGTSELLKEYEGRCTVMRMDKNLGGAGAYHEGFKWCVQNGADWVWCVEDDIIAPKDFARRAVEWLKVTKGEQAGFVYPTVLSVYDRHVNDAKIYLTGNKHINGALEMERALFSGVIINAKAIREVGLPVKEFFIYYDDWEFTARMRRAGWKGYWLEHLYVWHNDKPRPKLISYIHGRKDEMWKFYYGIRNELSVLKREAPRAYIRQLIRHVAIVPLKILIERPEDKLSVARNWSMWALKSLFFKFRIVKI